MTSYIAPPNPGFSLGECGFISSAKASYDTADDIVRVMDRQRRGEITSRRNNMNLLKSNIQSIENNLWEALARDYPKFRYRRQNQTVVISYLGDGSSINVNPGEIYKIKAWGVNDYSEALDTINRLQNRLWNTSSSLDRRWMDDWKRLEKQLSNIDRRNCKDFVEVKPGPILITPPICLPKPPNPPGPELPIYPCPPVALQGIWSTSDKRNWDLLGWNSSDLYPAFHGWFINRPSINIIDGRELIFYRTPGTLPTKIVWLFHGTGNSARSWFTDYEKIRYIKKFIDAGYAVAAYDSYNRVSKKWTMTANPLTNREIVGLKACQTYLGLINLLPSNQYGVGMSSGGNLASYAATALGLTKISIHNATGVDAIVRSASYNTDTLWTVSNNDLVTLNPQANDNYNYLQTNRTDLSTAYYNQQATKITSTIFDAIPSVSDSVANAILAGLISNGFVNGFGVPTSKYLTAGRAVREGYLQTTFPTIIAAAFVSNSDLYRRCVNDIIEQLKISFSDDEFSGWVRSESAGNLVLTDRDLAFFNS